MRCVFDLSLIGPSVTAFAVSHFSMAPASQTPRRCTGRNEFGPHSSMLALSRDNLTFPPGDSGVALAPDLVRSGGLHR